MEVSVSEANMADDKQNVVINSTFSQVLNICINKEIYVKKLCQLEKLDRILRFTQVYHCFTVYFIFF